MGRSRRNRASRSQTTSRTSSRPRTASECLWSLRTSPRRSSIQPSILQPAIYSFQRAIYSIPPSHLFSLSEHLVLRRLLEPRHDRGRPPRLCGACASPPAGLLPSSYLFPSQPSILSSQPSILFYPAIYSLSTNISFSDDFSNLVTTADGLRVFVELAQVPPQVSTVT